MNFLETIWDMIWVVAWLLFMFCIIVSIAMAGVFVVFKLVEFIRKNLL
jgi:hypothetical protein